MAENKYMDKAEAAIAYLCTEMPEDDRDGIAEVLENIRQAVLADEEVQVAIQLTEETLEMLDPEKIEVGDVIKGDDMRFKIGTLIHPDGHEVFVVFTSQEEMDKGQPTSIMNYGIADILEWALMAPDIGGVVINPWGHSFTLNKEMIKMIFKFCIPEKGENIIGIATMDITQSETAAIVNAANKTLLGGGGVDGAIHRAAGPELKEICRMLNGCEAGEAKITPGFNLKADYVIHTVGPIYSGSPEDPELLRKCYWNSLELARKHGIHSISFPAISTGVYGYPKEEATYIALLTVNDWMIANPNYGMAVLMACFDEKTEQLYREIYDKNVDKWNEREILSKEDGTALLEDAIKFAVDCHSGATRKGTDKPYILHPLEAVHIVGSIAATDYTLMAAAALHDVLEDTDTTLYEIYTRFGKDVANLVNSHTEDKSNNWYMRKQNTIDEMQEANLRVKVLAFADKLSNLRSIHQDYQMMGDELWNRFNAPKEWQAWYYGALQDAFYELQDYPEAADLYWEMVAKYKEVFVDFYIDDAKGMLYQMGASGESYVLKKGKPQWQPFDGTPSKKAELIHRKVAERIEDNWAEPFWEVHGQDMIDGSYDVYSSETTYVGLTVKKSDIHIYYDRLDNDSLSNAYIIHNDDAHRFMTQLRMKYSLRNKLSTILKTEFEDEDCIMKILNFCDDIGINVEVVRS